MARYEVTARATSPGGFLLPAAVEARAVGRRRPRDARLRCVTSLGPDEITVVLQPRSRRGQPDGAWLTARVSLFELGIDPKAITRVDVHRVSRRGKQRTLVRTWGDGPDGPGTAGDREPRRPLPSPPYLRAAVDLPE